MTLQTTSSHSFFFLFSFLIRAWCLIIYCITSWLIDLCVCMCVCVCVLCLFMNKGSSKENVTFLVGVNIWHLLWASFLHLIQVVFVLHVYRCGKQISERNVIWPVMQFVTGRVETNIHIFTTTFSFPQMCITALSAFQALEGTGTQKAQRKHLVFSWLSKWLQEEKKSLVFLQCQFVL